MTAKLTKDNPCDRVVGYKAEERSGDKSAENPQPCGFVSTPLQRDSEALSRRERLDLAYELYCQKIERSEKVDIESFCRGYPGLESVLRQQLVVHDAIDDRMSLLLACWDTKWPQAGDEIMGFRLVEEIGQGTFARVFRAIDNKLGEREVAVKLCRAGSHEAWILGRLKHENIVPIYSIQHDAELDLSVICMPYLGHVTLRDVISSAWSSGRAPTRACVLAAEAAEVVPAPTEIRHSHPFPRRGSYVDGVIFVGSVLAETLAYAHAEGVLHLDLKPSNVLVDRKAYPRLLDFNLASDDRRGMPRVGGTLAYMAPEQARCFLDGGDGSQLDRRSDVFSLGVILYEMLCGALPFGNAPASVSSHAAVEELVERQLRSDGAIWTGRNVDPRMRAIIERCMAIDPQDRYASAAALARDLKRESSVERRSARWIRSHRRLVMGALCVAVLSGSSIAAGLACREPYSVRQYTKARACMAAGQYMQSIDCLTRSIKADPEQPEALFARAQAYVATAEYHEAIEDLKAAGAFHTDARQLALLAYCCNHVSWDTEAIQFYRASLRHGYRSTAVYNNLGFSCFLRGQYGGALAALDSAVAMGDRPWVTLYNRAVVRHAIAVRDACEPTEAMHDIEKAISFGHCSARTYYRAAAIYGYASSLDASWKAQARKYVDLAVKHGTPAAAIRSDPFLRSLLDESALGKLAQQAGSPEEFAVTSHFFNPLE